MAESQTTDEEKIHDALRRSKPGPMPKPETTSEGVGYEYDDKGEIACVKIVSGGSGYAGKPLLPEYWAKYFGLWDAEYEKQYNARIAEGWKP